MSKREGEEQSLGNLIQQYIGNGKLQKGLDKVATQEAWNEIMGPPIAKYTTKVMLEGHTLYVGLSSSVLREELSYGKEKIIKLLNETLGKELIKKLVLK